MFQEMTTHDELMRLKAEGRLNLYTFCKEFAHLKDNYFFLLSVKNELDQMDQNKDIKQIAGIVWLRLKKAGF